MNNILEYIFNGYFEKYNNRITFVVTDNISYDVHPDLIFESSLLNGSYIASLIMMDYDAKIYIDYIDIELFVNGKSSNLKFKFKDFICDEKTDNKITKFKYQSMNSISEEIYNFASMHKNKIILVFKIHEK